MHILEYNQIVSSLYLVTQGKNCLKCGPEKQQAFEEIKQEITHTAFGPGRTGCELNAVHHSLKPLPESTWRDSRMISWVVESGIQRI